MSDTNDKSHNASRFQFPNSTRVYVEGSRPDLRVPLREIKDVQNRIIDMKSDRLERVQAALQSIDDGSYGTCIRCGKPIDPRRLDAEPAALTCMDCLSAEEKNFETATM